MNIKIAWVWYGFIYSINSSFPNHLKAQWYHYKFCKHRAEVFLLQLYLGEWRKRIQKIIEKHPGQIIPSHGLYAILKMIENQQIQKLVTFLESEYVEQGIETFIQELNVFNNKNPDYIETLPLLQENSSARNVDENSKKLESESGDQTPTDHENNLKQLVQLNEEESGEEDLSSSLTDAEQIHTRTYVIATRIYHEFYRTESEYLELKASPAAYKDFIKQFFGASNLSTSIYNVRDFDYRKVLNDPNDKGRGQLKKQLEQIINNPSVFGKRIVKQVTRLYKKYFG